MLETSPTFRLKIFVAGMTPAAKNALANLSRICADRLAAEAYSIEVCDIRTAPELAEAERILATPTVVRKQPTPIRRLVGDLSDEDQVVAGLGLEPS